ncbi:hypothetical protein FHX81_2327 [Saccharothrix saharensis]|uniref:Uncharacterized protein n=1 Tax=Saccharothrix saharensis TaxID=571190 RepID=A0A543JB63_9PSEU|nr:hypothetical protein [Saccharothrix saharensis]TQM80006.1 hypothetical protein FHX81_2327 [Saccharothrix saharensis]
MKHEVVQLPLDEDGDIPMRALSRQRRRDRGWDLLVLVTDLVPLEKSSLLVERVSPR